MERDFATRKTAAAELLSQDRQKLLVRMPFIGGLLMRLDLVPVCDPRLETAATNGDCVFVDIDFYGRLNPAERLFVLAHEAWHCALLHFMRRQGRDPDRFNAAADLEIHFILTDEGMKAPFVLPHLPSWKGLSAEEIYERLPKDYAEKGMPQNSRGGESASPGAETPNLKREAPGKGFDRHLPQEGDDDDEGQPCDRDADYSPRICSGTEERCRERLTAAAQMYERTRGDLPAGLRRLVDAVLKPELDWRELLAQFVTSCYGGDRCWLPPSRRHVWQGLYLQSQRKERLRATVAIDTSGSTSGDLPRFFAELTGLLGSFGSYELTVIPCDAEVGKVERFDDCAPPEPNHAWYAVGGGGTDFRPVFQYIEDHPEIDPNLLVFFTDGLGRYPERAPAYPVLWLLTEGGKCDAAWGAQAKLSKSEL